MTTISRSDTCGNCKWWKWDGYKRGRLIYRWGDCDNYSAWNRANWGNLRPRYDFGCLFHEPKQEED